MAECSAPSPLLTRHLLAPDSCPAGRSLRCASTSRGLRYARTKQHQNKSYWELHDGCATALAELGEQQRRFLLWPECTVGARRCNSSKRVWPLLLRCPGLLIWTSFPKRYVLVS